MGGQSGESQNRPGTPESGVYTPFLAGSSPYENLDSCSMAATHCGSFTTDKAATVAVIYSSKDTCPRNKQFVGPWSAAAWACTAALPSPSASSPLLRGVG